MKIKCRQCQIFFEKPILEKLITAYWVKFCTKSCMREFINIKREKDKVKEKKVKIKAKIEVKKVKAKEKKQNSASFLIKKADILFSKYIRLRDSIKTTWTYERCKCITCDQEYEIKLIQNWHFASRRFYQTRWLDKNCNAQCYMCNVWLWWEQYKHWKKIDEMYWEWTSEQIMNLAKTIEKLNIEEVKQIIENIQNELKDYV